MTEADLHALSGGDLEALSAKDRAVLAYAEAMTQGHVDVSESLFGELRDHFDGPQIVELTAAIAWENYRARFNHALLMEAEGYSEAAFCPLPQPRALDAQRA